jgi:hypothetical protein
MHECELAACKDAAHCASVVRDAVTIVLLLLLFLIIDKMT